MDARFVAILDLPGGDRLFCSDRFRDEWSGRFASAETFAALHEALEVAGRHGGRAMPWRDVRAFEAT